jgi:hypothetical protein
MAPGVSWASRRYTLAVLDEELTTLAAAKLDMRRDNPARPALLARIDALLEQRHQLTTSGDQQAGAPAA